MACCCAPNGEVMTFKIICLKCHGAKVENQGFMAYRDKPCRRCGGKGYELIEQVPEK